MDQSNELFIFHFVVNKNVLYYVCFILHFFGGGGGYLFLFLFCFYVCFFLEFRGNHYFFTFIISLLYLKSAYRENKNY